MKISLKQYIKLFTKYMHAQFLSLILLGILLILSVGISLLNPQIISYFIDSALGNKPARYLTIVALLFIFLAVLQQIILVLSTYLSQNIGWKTTNALREDLIKHCMNLDMEFHKTHKVGELLERVDGDVTALFNFFSNLFLKLLNNIFLLLGIIVLLLIKDYRIGLTMLGFTIFSIIVLSILQKLAVPRWVKERQTSSEIYGYIGEQISSTDDIRASGAVPYVLYRFYEMIKTWLKVNLKSGFMYGYIWMASIIIFAFGYVFAFSFSAYLYTSGIISIGSVYLIIRYTDLLERPIEQIRVQLQDLQKASASVVRIEELFRMKSNLEEGFELLPDTFTYNLQFDQVCFSYEDKKIVLDGISFYLKEGKILGLLGRTGSGKTSLSRLIVRLYDVTKGNIRINHTNIKDLSLKDMRKKIGYVTQDVELFDASIRDNLTFYNNDIEDEKILEAIDEMELTEWFSRFPLGLDTKLSSDGTSLSAGEAQLLSLLRVFIKQPKLLILDEASSRLDPITEKLIEKAMGKLLVGRTCIVIAHRLKTVEKVDDIMILDQGRIIEYGNKDELIHNSNSKFYALLKTGIEEVLA